MHAYVYIVSEGYNLTLILGNIYININNVIEVKNFKMSTSMNRTSTDLD